MKQSKNAYYKSQESSYFWMCYKERQKKEHLALNNQEHFLMYGVHRIFRYLDFSGKTADRMRAQMSAISGHGIDE